jgi:hypothetical protein
MPGSIGSISSSESGPGDTAPGYETDIGGDSGSSSGGGTVIVTPGSGAPSGYSYSVSTSLGVIGNAYASFGTSKINCHSCVAVLNRHRSFGASQNSSANIVNSVAYGSQTGFNAIGSSFLLASTCVASICDSNYFASNSSGIYVARSASVFPIRYGATSVWNSSWNSAEYETITAYWTLDTTAPIPAHFYSQNGSYSRNPCTTLTTKNSAGLSGPIYSNYPISFVWSQIYRSSTDQSLTINQNGLSISTRNLLASYHWVPLSQATDYGNVVGGTTVTQTTTISPTGLLSIIGNERTNYASVKPPSGMFLPEDGSGKQGAGGITGNFSVSALITST